MARRTKEDALATREALLDAAVCVFGRRGVARSSLAEIAEQAGLTRGAVYWHFKDKGELFNAMMDRVTLPLEADLIGHCEGQGDPVVELLDKMRRAMRTIEHDALTQNVLEIATLKVEHVDDMGRVRDRYVAAHRDKLDLMTQALERAAALRHKALPAPARTLAEGYHSLIHGLVFSWLLGRSFPLEQTAVLAMETYLAGAGLMPPLTCAYAGAANQG